MYEVVEDCFEVLNGEFKGASRHSINPHLNITHRESEIRNPLNRNAGGPFEK